MHLKTAFGLLALSWLCSSGDLLGADYYFNSNTGNDKNAGTSPASPFKSFEAVAGLSLKPGDALLLEANCRFAGSLTLKDVMGTSAKPVVVTSYAAAGALNDQRATIDGKGFIGGVLLENCSHIKVAALTITSDGGGPKRVANAPGVLKAGVVIIATKDGVYQSIELENLHISDVFSDDKAHAKPRTPHLYGKNGVYNYGPNHAFGIKCAVYAPNALIKDLEIRHCEVKNVECHGIQLTGLKDAASKKGRGFESIYLHDNRVLEVGGPGIQMSGVDKGLVCKNYVYKSGCTDDVRKFGRGSGLWTHYSKDVLIEHNYFLGANGPGDSAGAHIDYYCANVVMQYNFSANNEGGFCEILGDDTNCAYRYNVSVNDGARVKGVNGAFMEGKTYWLCGFVGSKKAKTGPYNSYFYNNTIYVGKHIVSKVSMENSFAGALIANNIFCLEGGSKVVQGDQTEAGTDTPSTNKGVIFENNLFLNADSWPRESPFQDAKAMFGDPRFAQPGGLEISDYIPANVNLIRDRGIEIGRIANDPIGLAVGLRVERDILGNQIEGKPDLGAIELR